MSAVIRGAKGGAATHTPVESPDNLRSISYFRILDLVSEGEIGGLVNGQQSIFLDETPLGNDDGTSNFPKAHIEQRTGTQDQLAIHGFDAVENEISVGVELTSASAWLHSVSDTTLSALRVTLSVPALSKANTSNGDITGYSIAYKIEISTDGGAFAVAYNGSFTGKTTTKFQRSHRLDLPAATTGWQVKVTRLTANAHSSAIADTTTVDSYTEIVDAKLRYPNSAVIGVMGDASQFSNIPQRAYDLWGRIVKVPSNYDVTTRAYTGVWDGTFVPSWTDNPAWIFYDLVTHSRYGLGHLVAAAQVDKWELYKIGQYCDGMVDDGNGGTEPRLTCNVYLQTQADAYKLLNDLSSAFRGISYWANGTIVASADMPADPVYTYTDANVIEGKFSYSASARKTRYTTALVSWNDPRNFYRTKVEYVEDRDGIARYGIQQTEVTAVGCASQGQAQRLGRWILLTSRYETDTVSFSVGLDGTLTAPGQIIRVADSARAGKRQGGRIHSATTTVVTVDKAPTVAVGDSLTVIMSDGVAQTRTVSAVAGAAITVSTAFTEAPAAQSMWVVESASLAAQTFRVLSVTEDKSDANISFTITALQHNASKFDAIDNGTIIQVPPISALTITNQPGPAAVSLSSVDVVNPVATYTVMSVAWSAVSGALSYEVEWRKDNGEWRPLGVQYGLSVDLTGAGAGDYTARVRAKGTGAAYSLFSYSNVFTIAAAGTLPTSVAAIGAEATAAQTSANQANAALANIASDGVLSPVEKPVVIRDWNVISAEQAGIDAQATAFAITTEKTAYDAAVTALANYLGTLTTPVMWNDLTGDTTIVGPTFRSNFASVYTTRQTLLNAIYAAAKAKADAAQTTANTANTTANNAAPATIVNPFFANGLSGWQPDTANAGWYQSTGSSSPSPNVNTYAVHAGSTITAQNPAGVTGTSLYNLGFAPMAPGQILSAACPILPVSAPDGGAHVRINWLNSSMASVGISYGNAITNGTGRGTSRVSAVAPAGAVGARVEVDVYSHTVGYYTYSGASWSYQPSNVGEVPDGGGRYAVHQVDPNGLALIDFTQTGHASKNLDNIGDGTTYGRVQGSDLTGNRMDFAKGLLNKNLGNMPDGGGRYGVHQVDSNGLAIVDFSQAAHVNKTLDNIADTALYRRLLASATAEAVDNPDFEASTTILPPPGWTNGGGVTPGYTTGSAYSGAQSLILTSTATFGLLQSARQYPCIPGEQYLVSAAVANNSGAGNTSSVYMQFFDKTGTSLSFGGPSNALAPGTGYQLLAQIVTVPANAVTFRLDLVLSGVSAAQSFFDNIRLSRTRSMDTEVRDGTTYGRTSQNDLYVSGGVNRVGLRIAGSGHQIGDQRNLTAVTFGNYGSGWSGLTFSYSSTTTSATISASAATLQAGSVPIAYNASSVTVSGSAGTTVTYYLYYDDPSLAGGAKTLQATTTSLTAQSSDGRVRLGSVSVTYPTSGTGSGGGGGPCVTVESFVHARRDGLARWIRAGDVLVGDELEIANPSTRAKRWGRVSYSQAKPAQCVRLTTARGIVLECSTAAPIGVLDGEAMLAPDLLGIGVPAFDFGADVDDRVTDVQRIGEQTVQHITCENDFFLAGAVAQRCLAHHNLKP